MKHMLSADNVKDAVRHWMNTVHGVRLPKNVGIKILYKTERVPGIEPRYDTFNDVFIGIEIDDEVKND